MTKKVLALLLSLALVFSFVACGSKTASVPNSNSASVSNQQTLEQTQKEEQTATKEESPAIDENGSYDSKDDVALYIHIYEKLPGNYMTKKEAQKLGWEGGALDRVEKGKAIGGDSFGNYEGLLPKSEKYKECDIDTIGQKDRGQKRIVFSVDCKNIYYTEDHYEHFETLYEAGEKIAK